jgi:hypothetical protein
MTVITTCNYCGGLIEDNSYIEVGGRGHDPTGYVNVYYGHYCSHAATYGEESCYERVRGAIWLVNGTGPALEAIETIPEYQVRQRRESFHRPGESIDELDITMRAYGLLRRVEIYTVEALTDKSKGQLMSIPGMGWKSLDGIEKALEKRGLKLRESA